MSMDQNDSPSFSRRGQGVVLERATGSLSIIMGAAFIALVVALAVMRLIYPYEVEWMEGAMLDHVVRIVAGKPIYSAPSIEFIPWLYPPLYYYVVAASVKIFGMGFFAGRIVSFLSTIFIALALTWTVRRVTKDRILSFLTFALYFATDAATGYYFDIVRNDAFFTLVIVTAMVTAVVFRGYKAAITTGIILTLGFLTKQQAIFFLPPLAIYLWFRNPKESIAFVLTSVVIAVIAVVELNISTGGWSNYYMFTIPSAKRVNIVWMRLFDVFPDYALGPLAVCTLAVLIHSRLSKSLPSTRSVAGERRTNGVPGGWFGFVTTIPGLLTMMSLASLAAGAMSLANEGGYRNVMMPFVAFIIPMLPIAMHELREWKPELSRYIYLPILFQFAALYFNPLSETMVIASAHQRSGGDQFMAKLRTIPGEVYIPYHGYITRQVGKESHAQLLATLDVLRVHDTTARRLQADFDTAMARHRFSAVILEECRDISCDSVAHYTLAGRMISEPNVMLTRFGSQATRPEFVFVPK